jgi:hypothetical protein
MQRFAANPRPSKALRVISQLRSNSVASLIGRFGSSAYQTIYRCSVDVSRGLALLFGLGTKALPSWESKTRWNNLSGGLAVRRMAGPSDQTNSPRPSSREGHHSTARWSSRFSYRNRSCTALMPLRPSGSSGTRCRQPRCGAGSRPTDAPAPRSPFSSHAAWRSASPTP